MSNFQKVVSAVAEAVENDEFQINPQDFLSARSRGGSVGTQIAQLSTSLNEAAQVLNRSASKKDDGGGYTNIISPVVIPKDTRSMLWMFTSIFLLIVGAIGFFMGSFISSPFGFDLGFAFFGPHYFIFSFTLCRFGLGPKHHCHHP